MVQNMPRDHRYYERRIAELERRIAALETAPRAGHSSISGGKLTIGAPDSDQRIELEAGDVNTIRFESASGPTNMSAFGGAAGLMISTSGEPGSPMPFGTASNIWNGSYFGQMQVNRVNGDGSNTVQSSIVADVQDSGSGNSRGSVALLARGAGDPDGSVVNIQADGGVMLTTNNRTTDPPAPPAGTITLYVKANRLYYRDGTGTVRGPL